MFKKFKDHAYRLRLKEELKLLLQIGIPVIIGNLLQTSMSVVDTIMAGNLSPVDLAAVAVGSSIFMPIFILGAGILMAVSPIVAQHFGAGNHAQIGKTTRQSLWLAIMISIPAIIVLRNMNFVLELMSVEPEIIPLTLGYLDAISWGIMPLCLYIALRQFNEGISITKPAMYISLLGLCFNVIGNYTLMYGKFGFPKLGAVGTGYASAIVMFVMFIALIIYTYRKKSYKEFEIFKNLKLPDRKHISELLKVGVPIGISMCMEVTMFAVVTLLMGSLGTYAVAGHQIAINFASITFMIAFGLSAAITVRVGQVMGRSGIKDARFSGFAGVGLAAVFMSITALLMFIFPGFVSGLYTDDPELKQIAIQLIYMAAIFQLSDGLQVSGLGALRGLKDTKIPMYVNLVAYWIVGLPLGYLLGIQFEMGPQGLWIGLIAGLTVAGILHNVRFNKLTKKMIRGTI
ncbi:MAG TPA: MATE family efflux transporter [Bacteroidetes bacterium]|nr:MATE family efflux transporter [Bacteroidota bacterium]